MDNNKTSLFNQINSFLLKAVLFLFPFFFLPITQDFFLFNKLYLLALVVVLLFLSSIIQLMIEKKPVWQNLPSDKAVILFLLTVALSITIISPNKVQAILNANNGLLVFLSLTFLYFYLSRTSAAKIFGLPLFIGSLITSIITIIFLFQPFAKANLPQSLVFLKNPYFNPVGGQVELAIWFGFVSVYLLLKIINERKNTQINNSIIFFYLNFVINLTVLSITIYTLFKPGNPFILPPFNLSWYAAVEVLKQPLNALFGAGVDNFSSVFTQVKNIPYNQSPSWTIASFPVSRSAILHLLTELGVLGLLGFSLIIYSLWNQIKDHADKKVLFFTLLAILFFLPPSLIGWLLFFAFAADINKEKAKQAPLYRLNLAPFPPLVYGLALIWLVVTIAFSYLLGRNYLAEYYFKKSLDGLVKNDTKMIYDNNRLAIITNPYIERFRLQFSQVNLTIANNILQNALERQNKQKDNQSGQLSENDKQSIYQAIQAAINEGKAAVALNPQKAQNWENLASIYRSVINISQQADLWAISSYQRAIVLDPQNPFYRLNLGGLYYSLNNFEEAGKLFEQAIALKPDWPNAHYNLAWADYQKGNYKRAVSEMENTLSLLDPKKNKGDYEKAKQELEKFKEKLPKEEQTSSSEAKPAQLNLPTPIPSIAPQISLPKEASPEAK
jgi:tetratricopeptide (TPR) repeat protein